MALNVPVRLLLLCALAPLTTLAAQTRGVQKPPRPTRPPLPFAEFIRSYDETPFVTRAVFKNGLTVLVNEFRVAPVTTVMMWAKTGMLDEPSGRPGIARLVEQMLYDGTASRGPGVIGKDVRALGGDWSSSTGLDHTRIEIVGPSAQWKRMLEILSDACQNPSLDAQELRREADRLRIDEAAEYDDPATLLTRRLWEIGLGRSVFLPVGKPGSEPTRDNLQDYFRAAFQPAQTILVVAGDVVSTEVLNEVARLHGKAVTPTARPASPRTAAPQGTLRYAEVFGRARHPRIGLGFPAPALGSPDFPAVEVLNRLIGGGEASIVNRRLKYEKKVVLGGTSEYAALSDTGALQIQLEVAPDDVDRAEIALVSQLELLRREDPDEVDVARAAAQAERAHWESLETTGGRARMLAAFESLGDWKRMNAVVDRIRKITPAEIRRVASKYLGVEKASLVELLSAGAVSRNLTAETAYRTLHDLLDPTVEQLTAEREKEVVTAVDVPSEGEGFKFSEVRHPIQRASVLRGPDLFIREDHSSPLIHLGMFFPGGRLTEKKANAGITMLMLRSIFRGTKERPAEQFWRQLEVYGGKLDTVATEDFFGVFLTILSRNVDAGLSLVIETFRYPAFDKDEFERVRNIQRTQAVSLDETVRARRDLLLAGALFGEHAYALPAIGTEQSLAAIDSESMHSWYRNSVQNFKPVVVILGDTQGTSLAQFFVKSFSGTRIQDAKLPDNPVKAGSAKVAANEKTERPIGLVSLAYPAPPEGDDDSFVLALVGNLLGGQGGRLWEQLVEKQRVAGDVSIEYRRRLRGGSFVINATTLPGNEDKAMQALEAEIQQFLTSTLLFRDYRSALNHAVGAYTVERQDRKAVIADLVRSVIAGRSLEGYLEHQARLQEVGQDDLQEAGNRFLKPSRSVAVELEGRPSTP